ncbi:PTS glucitol/sorbitol transporter subunit IIA [Enemella sp. A6]|uniref:PTS glucitol/sorbitol transporter subunit IIA n=1 Tax=Enemella sp. A6 TaxID=3440152 RepID=UPI003EC0C931
MTTIWSTTVTRVGNEAGDMIDAGLYILFGEPVPDALADVSVVHSDASEIAREVKAGDTFVIGDLRYVVDEIGDRANTNLADLGHIVLYINQPDQDLLPGAVKASGPDPVAPAVGATITIEG